MTKHTPTLASILCLLVVSAASAQEDTASDEPEPPAAEVEEEIDVVALTPFSEMGVNPERFPWSSYQLDTTELSSGARDIAAVLESVVPGVHVNSVQNNPLQPDVYFRGFSTSPLLGAAQGLSVWEDGVRVNEIFGDVVQWDLLPSLGLDRVELMAGAHAAFGPNTLGGAISLRTKNGRDSEPVRLTMAAGSWRRYEIGLESGAVRGPWAGYGVGELFNEDGWRDFSPTRSARLFGKLSFQEGPTSWDLGVGWAHNRLIGNGAAPIELLAIDRAAVFTHPDETRNDLLFPRLQWQRSVGADLLVEAVVFLRDSQIATFNADEAASDRTANATNNRSHTDQRGLGASLQLTRSHRLGSRANLLAVGASWENGEAEFDSSGELATFTPNRSTIGLGIFDPAAWVAVDGDVSRIALFVSDSVEISRRATLNLQARYDESRLRLRDRLSSALDGDHRFARFNGALGWSLELRPETTPRLIAFAGLNRSSRNPTPVELTCADPEDPCRLPNAFVADPPLDEVVTTGWEAGLRGRSARVSWSAAIFGARNDNDILFISSGRFTNAGHFTNVEETLRRGFELSLRGRLRRHSWFLAYTDVDATFGSELTLPSVHHPLAVDGEILVRRGDSIPGIPKSVAKAGVTLHFNRFGMSTIVRSQSSRFLRGDEANRLSPVPGFVTADLDVSWSWRPWLLVGLGVSNVLDEEFETFGLLGNAEEVLGDGFSDPRFLSPGAPRSIRLRLEITPYGRGS